MTHIKKLTYIVLVALFVAVSTDAKAQKKWSIGGKSNLISVQASFGNIFGFDALDYDYTTVIVPTITLDYRRILSKKWELNAGAGIHSSDMIGRENGFTDIPYTIGFRYYRYSVDGIAPIGPYYRFGYRGSTATDFLSEGGKVVQDKYRSMGVYVGFGKEVSLGGNLFLGYGLDFSLTNYALTEQGSSSDEGWFPAAMRSKNYMLTHFALSYLF